ncbi:MAG: RimK family alpha-L-glutamate ligase [Candidatus Thorarchaeota archaeon]
MKIGILSKRKTHFTGKMKKYYESKGMNVKIFSADNSNIDENLLENDFFILKSKKMFYLYAGYFLEANNIPVIPNTEISFKNKNRVESKHLAKKAGFLVPKTYLGTIDTIINKVKPSDYPLILKPIMGSGSRGVKVINTKVDLKDIDYGILFLEKFIFGKHYLAYFIGDEFCVCEKKPLTNEHAEVKKINVSNEVKEILAKWKNNYNLLFGHLDIVQEDSTNRLYIVDSGSFPEFSNWKCEGDPVSKVCNLILEKFKDIKIKI